MKKPSPLVVSLVLNLALLSTLAVVWIGQHREPASSESADVSGGHTGLPPAKPLAQARSGETPDESGQTFDWQRVESEDYREYVANLRAVGCPEETIRDIIKADVNELYQERAKGLARPKPKFEYWKTGLNQMIGAVMPTAEELQQRQGLSREKRALLKTLLGDSYEPKPDLTDMMNGMNPFESMLDFVPGDKQTELIELEQRYGVKLMQEMGDGVQDREAQEKMMAIQREKEAEIAQLLTPEEKEQYDLRMSQTANMMRIQLDGFDPTPEEFKSIFNLQKEFDDQWGLYGFSNNPENRAQRTESENALKAEIKDLLGEERFQEYTRAQDYTYKGMVRVADRVGVSKEAANQVYEMKRIAEEHANAVRTNTDLAAAQRQEALQQIRAETEKAIIDAFGQEGFKSYSEENYALWLQQLDGGFNRVPEAVSPSPPPIVQP